MSKSAGRCQREEQTIRYSEPAGVAFSQTPRRMPTPGSCRRLLFPPSESAVLGHYGAARPCLAHFKTARRRLWKGRQFRTGRGAVIAQFQPRSPVLLPHLKRRSARCRGTPRNRRKLLVPAAGRQPPPSSFQVYPAKALPVTRRDRRSVARPGRCAGSPGGSQRGTRARFRHHGAPPPGRRNSSLGSMLKNRRHPAQAALRGALAGPLTHRGCSRSGQGGGPVAPARGGYGVLMRAGSPHEDEPFGEAACFGAFWNVADPVSRASQPGGARLASGQIVGATRRSGATGDVASRCA